MTFVVDISNVPQPIGEFPNGPVEATIAEAKLDVVEANGNPIIRLIWDIYHPDVGVGRLFDSLPSAFPAKAKAFWQALNDFTSEEMMEQANIELNAPELVGAQMIVHLGEKEAKQGKHKGELFKQVVSPFYYPISRLDVLSYDPNAA